MTVTAAAKVLQAHRVVSSPDQDGSLMVDATDVMIVNGLIGTRDTGADFDGDGTVTTADLAWLTDLHGGHSSVNAVPARAGTWGAVKLRYRRSGEAAADPSGLSVRRGFAIFAPPTEGTLPAPRSRGPRKAA